MNPVGDHVARHIIVKQAPADGSRRPMMQRGHRVHEVRQMARARLQRLIKHLDSRARMTEGNYPTAFGDFFD